MALAHVGRSIEIDEDTGEAEGHEEVLDGLEALADALSDHRGLDVGSSSLDEVLAEMNVGEDIMERAASLIRELGQVSYGILPIENGRKAEELRGELYDEMDRLLSRLEQE
ncbi:MAG TPA: hypothetical protein VLS89_18105 [Candidatus Nanopelagicales bacterium]|nr:hypothetical protein [Candidatus Nanopelagicales bacterium]